MGWSDVKNRIKFFGQDTDDLGNPTGLDGMPTTVNGIEPYGLAFSTSTENGATVPTEKADILAALEDLYDHSATARSMLDAATAGEDIWLMKSINGSTSKPGTGTAKIDLESVPEFWWMGSDGKFHQEQLGGNVIHELIHAVYGYDDLRDPTTGLALGNYDHRDYNNPNFDFLGQTVRLQNQIFQERNFEEGYSQVGYDAAFDIAPSLFRKDISYTEGQLIDLAYFDNAGNLAPNVLDLSLRTDSSRDLIIGLAGDDRINGGAGRDYLYGGAGNDTISGGSGDDVIHGGDRTTPLVEDGSDTADYSVGDSHLPVTHGVTVEIDPSAGSSLADVIDGLTPIIVSDDGYGYRDRLFSIEKLMLTAHGDTVLIGAGSDVLLKPLQEIDAGDNGTDEADILDFSGSDGALTVADGKLTGTDISILIKNFEQVIGSSSGDAFNFAGTSVTKVEGGAGDDVITAGDSYAILLGGAGNDTLIAGSAGSILDGGQSDGFLFSGDANHYVGGDGADIFVIGNGADAKNGSSANFIISNAGETDRLVLRLDDSLGFANEQNWTKGIVLNGGVQAIGENGVDPDQLYAGFSNVLVNPTGFDTNSDGIWITETSLDNVRPELGYFQVAYQWYKPESQLFVYVDSSYGKFGVRVDGFENGELGLNFTSVPEPKMSVYDGSQSPSVLTGSWTSYNNAMQSLVESTTLIDLPSPGDPTEGNASPITPFADLAWWPYPLSP
ncbi:calcium-binding protein [Bradyrhizobium betae]|uniref:Calcium-binding protein n=1 Tax=Bradyrhizobium betae TaxID=244734 RepID=A0A4Q1VJX5_9BRAD|nr:calcium-binding protein [Bradyrhizobium betae]RXT50587.1 hypothetical protein B5V03_06235 [Bradyrhizobium betae]